MNKRTHTPWKSETLTEEMAFKKISLWCTHVLLPLFVAGEVPPPCVLPFIYRQKSYSSCTNVGSQAGTLWCATTPNYDLSPQWKNCTTKEHGGNSAEKSCVFPFIFKKRTFYSCTNEDAQLGRFWCATTGNYDNDKKWSHCADTRLAANSQGPCVFPFIYNKKPYSSCTTDGALDGKLWCSLSSNYDADPRWTYCDRSEPRPCAFPFIFKEKSYSACTREGSADHQLWCATTSNYDKDGKWKACTLQDYEGSSKGQACVFPFIYKSQKFYTCTNQDDVHGRFWCATTGDYDKDKKSSYCADTRYEGNSNGQPCVFPFIYGNEIFYTCTNKDEKNGRFWCATTGDYDKDKKWSYCGDAKLDPNKNGACVFPFTYKGKTYSSCTTDGAFNGTLWCSLTSNYDADSRWTYCSPSEALPCNFPFIYMGKSYSACTKDGSTGDQFWCATTANYDHNSKWKSCSIQEYEGSAKGQACTFPFIYKGQIFTTCINKDSAHGQFWCATTNNYDEDKKWSYCADTRLGPNAPCIFPFTFSGKSYSSCTTDGDSKGKLWCSPTRNYDADRKWIYCSRPGMKNWGKERESPREAS